jgi:hypothetical protein
MVTSSYFNDSIAAVCVKARYRLVVADLEHNRVLCLRLDIRDTPTAISFHRGKEIDRLVAFTSQEMISGWLRSLNLTMIGEKAKGVRDNPLDIIRRIELAYSCYRYGFSELATEHYIELWNSRERLSLRQNSVALSTVLLGLQRFLRSYEPARDVFARSRDQIDPRLRVTSSSDSQLVEDWIYLNAVLSENDKTLEWFDSVSAPDLVFAVRGSLIPLFVKAGRLADAGRLISEPEALLRDAFETRRSSEQRLLAHNFSKMDNSARSKIIVDQWHLRAITIIRMLMSASRMAEATYISEITRTLDSSSEMDELISRTLR